MTKRQFILETNEFASTDYYTGKSYIHHGQRYAIVDRDISKAKIYSSEARAKKANERCFENYTFQLVPLDE